MLFQPYQIKGLTLRNRLVMAPMTTYSSNPDFTVSASEYEYYALRSQTIGLLITAATSVSDSAQAFPNQISLKDDRFIPGMSQLVDVVHQGGAKIIVQLHHGGRMNEPQLFDDHRQIVSASAVKAEREYAVIPRALETKEVYATIDDFAKATKRAIEAGFDGVELHGANTYLLQQFFSPHSNRRTDEFGGSLEKRMRFSIELIKAVDSVIKTHAKQPFICGYRLSPEELETPGITIEDTLAFVDVLKTLPIDYLHVSLSRYNQSLIRDETDNEAIATKIQRHLKHQIPLIGVGGIDSTENAEDALAMGYDLVAVGMRIIAEPLLGYKMAHNLPINSVIHRNLSIPEPLFNRLLKYRRYFKDNTYTIDDK